MTVTDVEYTYSYTGSFSDAFYTGTSASSAMVPDTYHAALDGRPFLLDTEMLASQPMMRTIPTLRTQNDDREAGELSLNPEGLWRRSASSWELGAGQANYDDEVSQRQQFRASKGIDVWTRGQATLLADTTLQATVNASADPVQIESTATHLYWSDWRTVVRSDLATETNVTGTPATAITSMVSVGSYVLVGYTGNGVYQIQAGASTASAWMIDAVTPSVVGWAKGRVIVCVGPSIYNPVTAFGGAAALPVALLTHPDPAFTWKGVAEGTSWIYAGGTSGDKSTIYRMAVRADGTSLDIPTVAGRLPDGETLTTLQGYLGVLLIGTTRGFRVAQANGNGDLVIGALADIGAAIHTMQGRGQFVYFGWTNYDATSTGIGRMDLSNLTDVDNLVPAYATDLMVAGQGTVTGLGYLGRLVIGIAGTGVYKQADTLVTAGTLDTGLIRYGITEDKVVTGAKAAWVGSGTVTLQLSRDGGTFASIAPTGAQERGTNFEMRATITRVGAESPIFKAMTLFCYPAPEGTMFIDLPVIIAEQISTEAGIETYLDVAATIEFFRDRFRSKALVALQLGILAYQVTLEQWRFLAATEGEETRGSWNGTAILSLKVIT